MRLLILLTALSLTPALAAPLEFHRVRLFENTTTPGQYWAIDGSNWRSKLVERTADGETRIHEVIALPGPGNFETALRLEDNRIFFVPPKPPYSVIGDVLPESLITPGLGREILREIPSSRARLKRLGFDLNVLYDPSDFQPRKRPPNLELVWISIPFDESQRTAARAFCEGHPNLRASSMESNSREEGILQGWTTVREAQRTLRDAKKSLNKIGYIYRELLDAQGPSTSATVPDSLPHLNNFDRSRKFAAWLDTVTANTPNAEEDIGTEIFYLEVFRNQLSLALNFFRRPTPPAVKDRYQSHFTGEADRIIAKALRKLHERKSDAAIENLIFAGQPTGFEYRATWLRLPYLIAAAFDGRTYFEHWLNRLVTHVTWPLRHPKETWPFGANHRVGQALFIPVEMRLSDPAPTRTESPYYIHNEEYWGVLAMGLARDHKITESLLAAILEMDGASKRIHPRDTKEGGTQLGQSHTLHNLLLGLRGAYLWMRHQNYPAFSETLYVEQAADLIAELLSTAQWHELTTPSYLALVQTAAGLGRDAATLTRDDREAALGAVVRMQNAMNIRVLRAAFSGQEFQGCESVMKAR